MVGRSWFPPEKLKTIFVSLYTDASRFAWGAHFHHKYYASPTNKHVPTREWAQGPNNAPNTDRAQGPLLARSVFNTDIQNTGSTSRELEAVLQALKLFAPHCENACVRLFTDNTGVQHILNKGFA